MDCSICYDQITASTGKVELSCSHSYHFSCLTSWFKTQAGNSIEQSCPCCRHVSNEHETMKVTVDDESEDDESESESESETEELTEQEAIDLAAAQERASMRIAKMKREMTKGAFEHYAASKIAALYRGRCARFMVAEIYDIRQCIKQRMEVINAKKEAHRVMKNALTFNMKAITMSHSAWRNYAVSIIQKAWRAASVKSPLALLGCDLLVISTDGTRSVLVEMKEGTSEIASDAMAQAIRAGLDAQIVNTH